MNIVKPFLSSEFDGGDHAGDDPHQSAHTDDEAEPEGDSVLRDGRLVVGFPVGHVGTGRQLLAVDCLTLSDMLSWSHCQDIGYIDKVDRGVVRH